MVFRVCSIWRVKEEEREREREGKEKKGRKRKEGKPPEVAVCSTLPKVSTKDGKALVRPRAKSEVPSAKAVKAAKAAQSVSVRLTCHQLRPRPKAL